MNSEKPVIVAICGKSATGKDTLAKRLVKELKDIGYDAGLVVSDTTRPPRVNEKDGVDYHFISPDKFIELRNNNEYLEYTSFKGWKYGTPQSEIKHQINVGVFNLTGISNLSFHSKYTIVPVYLKNHWWIRLKRSVDREHQFKTEHFRRMITDYQDFKKIDHCQYLPYWVVISGKNVFERLTLIIEYMSMEKIL